MDEIEYKLRSQNPTLISHAISKLVEIVVKKLKLEEDISKITEFKLLASKCHSDDFLVCTSACQSLVILVEKGLCDVQSVLATFITCLSSSKNYQVITTAVTQLLILDWKACSGHSSSYSLEISNQHPFITILNQEKGSWRFVLHQMKSIMGYHDREIMEQSIELLRCVFMYILCNPCTDLSDSCKKEAWKLIIESNSASDLQVEILLWLCTNRVHICIDTNYRLLELAEVSLLGRNAEYCTALIPLLASLTIQLLEHGHEPVQNFSMILNLIEKYGYSHIGDITIILMAEIILICPAAYLFKALEICTVIVDKMPCNIVLLNALVASLLKWLAYPSLLCSDTLIVAKEIVNKITLQRETNSSDNTFANKMLLIFGNSNRYIRFYTEFIRSLYSLGNDTLLWLENLSNAPIDLRYMCKMVLCGIFLCSDEPFVVQKTCHILVQMMREINAFASHVLSLLLYKLTKLSHDSSTSKCLLLAIPEFVTFKENLPIIIHTLDTLLNSDKPLKYFAIQLYAKALEKEPRCYRFISAALMDTMEHDCNWHSDVTCARAMKCVCESRPELSEELVPLLSRILNRCADLNGGAASALALDCVTVLCKSAIIGVFSTWKVIAPKMRKEKRTMILDSLCELFANISSYQFRSIDDYESFFNDAVTLLWSYVIGEDARIAKSALKALRFYSFAQIPLKALPPDFVSDLVLPQAYLRKTATDKPEESLQYVPGSCWIHMLKKVNTSARTTAGDLLIVYIEEELSTFKSRIYNWPQGEPRDFKYLSERSVIRAVGEYVRRGDKTDSSNHRISTECLRIFAHKYTKPLPNVKWDFLESTMQMSGEAKEYGLSIATRNSCVSQSAVQLVENFLSKYKDYNKSASDIGQLLLNEKHMVFYSNLCELCQAFQSQDLKPFLETSLDYVIDKISLNDEKGVTLFNHIMLSYATALRSDEVHVGNRTLLSILLERVFDKIDLTSKGLEEYFTAVMEMSVKDVERMISPNIWWEITTRKMRNAIAIATELAFRKFTDTPLVWLNELIDVVASNPIGIKEQRYLLESIQRVQAELRLEKYCVDWILDLMSRINALMVGSSDEEIIVFYCDVLFISVIYLSGIDCLLPRKELLIASQDVRIRLFPQAISMLADRQIWKSITRQIMNWLNHMRTSSVPDIYRTVFQSSLILLRHEEDYNSHWTNYLSIKTCIHI